MYLIFHQEIGMTAWLNLVITNKTKQNPFMFIPSELRVHNKLATIPMLRIRKKILDKNLDLTQN